MSWSEYLNKTLGIRHLILPAQPIGGAEVLAGDFALIRILFLAEPRTPALGELEIFQKMLAAMKLEVSEFQIWEITGVDLAVREKEISSEWVVVCFSPKLSRWLCAQRRELTLITTPHPLECLQEPGLKRQVWVDLQEALEKSGLGPRLRS